METPKILLSMQTGEMDSPDAVAARNPDKIMKVYNSDGLLSAVKAAQTGGDVWCGRRAYDRRWLE